MLLPGGGGCPAYDVLVEDLPFDFLQPPMQKQITQAGYGGPYVIRSNPIGAIWDAIRGFCFPATMQATSDGNLYMDTSGAGVDSAGYPVTDTSGLGYGGGYSGFGTNPYQTNPSQCGTGTMYDYTSMMCVPSPPAANTPTTTGGTAPTSSMCACDITCLTMLTNQATTACAGYDSATLTSISVQAKSCADALGAINPLGASFVALSKTCLAWVNYLNQGKTCSGMARPSTMTTPPATTPSTPTPPATTPSTPTTGGGMTGGTGTVPPAMMNTGPLGYIGAANPGGGNPTTPPATVTPAPPNMPPSVNLPRLPQMPSPMDMTEGNLGMMPTSEPMGGAFDPRSIGTGGTFSNVRGNIGSLGRQRFR